MYMCYALSSHCQNETHDLQAVSTPCEPDTAPWHAVSEQLHVCFRRVSVRNETQLTGVARHVSNVFTRWQYGLIHLFDCTGATPSLGVLALGMNAVQTLARAVSSQALLGASQHTQSSAGQSQLMDRESSAATHDVTKSAWEEEEEDLPKRFLVEQYSDAEWARRAKVHHGNCMATFSSTTVLALSPSSACL